MSANIWSFEVLTAKFRKLRGRLQTISLDHPCELVVERREVAAKLAQLQDILSNNRSGAVRRALGEAAVALGEELTDLHWRIVAARDEVLREADVAKIANGGGK